MRAVPADFRLLLPKGWPEHIRSAVIHVISLAHFSATFARSVATNSINARIRLKAENSRLRQEIALLREEARIKDSRMDRIPAQRRPHYPPIERMAVLALRAARGWSLSQTAQRFLDFVRYIVRRLKVVCRAGSHLSSATVGRMLREPLRPEPRAEVDAITRIVAAKRPNHVWHMDLSAVPISSGIWTAWLQWALPQRWPFCWWVAIAVDHFSRRDAFRRELTLFIEWLNGYRPPACLAPRFEPRA